MADSLFFSEYKLWSKTWFFVVAPVFFSVSCFTHVLYFWNYSEVCFETQLRFVYLAVEYNCWKTGKETERILSNSKIQMLWVSMTAVDIKTVRSRSIVSFKSAYEIIYLICSLTPPPPQSTKTCMLYSNCGVWHIGSCNYLNISLFWFKYYEWHANPQWQQPFCPSQHRRPANASLFCCSAQP